MIVQRILQMFRELQAAGRADLESRVSAGELSLRSALAVAYPSKYRRRGDGFAALQEAWHCANQEQRAQFVIFLIDRMSDSKTTTI